VREKYRFIVGGFLVLLSLPLVIIGVYGAIGLNIALVFAIAGLASGLTLCFEAIIAFLYFPPFNPEVYKQNLEQEVAERTAELENWLEQLSIVNLITQVVNTSSELSAILEATVQQVGQFFQVSRCMIVFFNQTTKNLTLVSDYHLNGVASDALGLVLSLKDYPLTIQALEQGQSMIVTEAQTNPLTIPAHYLLQQWHLQNLLIVPLLAKGRVNGLIVLATQQPESQFTSTDMTLVELIASQIAGVINNGQLLQELRQSEQEFRRVIEFSPLAMAITNKEGRVEYLNQKHVQTFGYTLTDVPTVKDWWFLAYPQHRYRTKIKTNWYTQEQLAEAQVTCKNGTIRDVEFRYTPIGDRVLHVLHDVTEHKAVAIALAKAKEEAEQANQAKTAFLANMSHELRTPLNAVLGFTQLLQRETNTTPEQQEYLQTINRSGEHLLSLINDVLELSKIETGRVKLDKANFDLYQMLDDIEAMMRLRAIHRKLQFIFEVNPDVPRYICTDERKLRQVLLNLLGNGIKFTDEGGVVLRVLSQPLANNPSLTELKFEVEDTGYGVAVEELNLLFEPFAQTESGRLSQGGTGLGLPLSRQFVELLGGEMAVKSTRGVGTLFSFTVLVQIIASMDVPHQPINHKVIGLAAGQPKYRILVVEDKVENRLLLKQLLESIGFEVQEASNGQEAYNISLSWQPDLIWMDIRMPVMNGYEATRRIKAQIKDTPIIALTASAFIEERHLVFEAGCDDLVRKPFRDREIFDKMSEYLGVRYIYQEEKEVLPLITAHFLPQQLMKLLPEWLGELQEATKTANFNQQLKLVEQIRPHQPILAGTLTELINRFAYDELLTLIEATKNL